MKLNKQNICILRQMLRVFGFSAIIEALTEIIAEDKAYQGNVGGTNVLSR
jgi:hypothetical protein